MERRGYKIPEVCEMLAYSRSTVYDLIKKGKLLTYGKGPGLRVRADSLEVFINGGAEPTTQSTKAHTSKPRRRSVTAGASGTKEGSMSYLTKYPRGQPLDLEL